MMKKNLRTMRVGARISTASGSERGPIKRPLDGATLAAARGTDSERKMSGGRMSDGKIGAFAKFGNFAGQDRSYAAVDDESQRPRFGQGVGHAGEFLVLKRNDDLLTARIGRKPAPAVDDRRRGAAQPEFIPLRDLSEQSVAKLFDDDLFAGL